MTGFSRVAVMLSLCGAVAGFTVSVFVPHRYLASATLVFVSPYDADAKTLFERASEETLQKQSLELMIRRSPYFKSRLYVEPAGDIIAETRGNLNITSAIVAKSTRTLIEFEDDDVDTALDVTRVLLSEFGNNAARIANAKKGSDVIRIVNAPDARLTGLTPGLLTAGGLGMGLLAALLIRFSSGISRRSAKALRTDVKNA